METSVVSISPEQAIRMLATNKENNRSLKERTVNYYAHQMMNGQWRMTGEPIKFSKSGKLIDGQHRLNAVVKANRKVDFLVITNLEEDIFQFLDTGVTRTARDIFDIAGISNYSSIAASTVRYLQMKAGANMSNNCRIKEFNITKKDALDFYYENKNILEKLDLMSRRLYKKFRILTTTEIVSLSLLLIIDKMHTEQKVSSFFSELYDEIPCSNNCIKLLREKLINSKINRIAYSPIEKKTLIAKTWNNYVTGKQLTLLKIDIEREGEIEFI